VNDDLNRQLLGLLKAKARGKFTTDATGAVHYAHHDEDLIANDLISSVRDSVFHLWQVVHCPAHWTESYKRYMSEHKVPFTEEIRDDELRFLIPRSYDPHSWELQEPRTRGRPRQ